MIVQKVFRAILAMIICLETDFQIDFETTDAADVHNAILKALLMMMKL